MGGNPIHRLTPAVGVYIGILQTELVYMNKKLCLSSKSKILAGVCGGIAEYFRVDPTLIRIIWVLLTLTTYGSLIIIYIVCWAIMPMGE